MKFGNSQGFLMTTKIKLLTTEQIEQRRKYQREWKREHYDYVKERARKLRNKNKAKYLQTLNRRLRENKKKAVEYLGSKCNKCEQIFPPEVYDIHHRDPTQKLFGFSQIKGRRFDNVKSELDKCDLLCANCHRILHAELDQENERKRIETEVQETCNFDSQGIADE